MKEQLVSALSTSENTQFVVQKSKETLEQVNKFLNEYPKYTEEFKDAVEILNRIPSLKNFSSDTVSTVFKANSEVLKAINEGKQREKRQTNLVKAKEDFVINEQILSEIESKICSVDNQGNYVRKREVNGKEVSLFRTYLSVVYRDNGERTFEFYNKRSATSYVNSNEFKIKSYSIKDEWSIAAAAWKVLRNIKNKNLLDNQSFDYIKNMEVVKLLEKGYTKYLNKLK